jgi:hypothetical protein
MLAKSNRMQEGQLKYSRDTINIREHSNKRDNRNTSRAAGIRQ